MKLDTIQKKLFQYRTYFFGELIGNICFFNIYKPFLLIHLPIFIYLFFVLKIPTYKNSFKIQNYPVSYSQQK